MKTRSLSCLARAMCVAGLVLVTLAAAAGAAGSAPAGSSPRPPLQPIRPYQPGDRVWTTSESVPPPGAVMPAAPVDPYMVKVSLTPADRPYRPGDQVWTTNAQVPPPAQPDANGCQRVPSSGYIGTDVYGSTSYEYANEWDWTAGTSYESFHWYIRRLSDDMAMYDGHSAGGAGQQFTTANNWRWQVQNQGTDPQAWQACFHVL